MLTPEAMLVVHNTTVLVKMARDVTVDDVLQYLAANRRGRHWSIGGCSRLIPSFKHCI